ncbi:Cystathionine beta-synthase, core domain protein [Rhodopirellula maiorica SM1]|uniref:Cystathionine beta-synthase, core domain protein n=1 Tax=Rhodopirellula maiorica SM1 TaxID=1265738 RepID=M5RBR2_9BACT|nr:CBS domain-containing protein [Rhodopirellula maiorica]EMI16511.1 Cystathionine beta-synthase, core domain protein [Rhodopirellula maiorica SM1]
MTTFAKGDEAVEAWMSTSISAVDREATVRDVLELMKSKNVSSIPVVDSEGNVVGIVTRGDLANVVLSTDQILDSDYPHFEDCLWAVELIQRRFGTDKVTEVMSENVALVHPETTMNDAAKQMADDGFHHLAVTKNKKLLGMLSASDFVRLVAGGSGGKDAGA